ncbi:acyl-CoA dehydrogenase family protein [Streptomyces sp. NPDC052396]|uniref:acyl-CoA dehydrogenase family protein n=1 Tax=Streptomyces sp. NPDC052396 TaxID=3365689 RepID=UPI0037CFFC5E
MDVELSAEQREIRRTLRELLLKRCGSGEVRAAVATPVGWDRGLWRELASLGLAGLAVPKRYGGVGCGWTELALAAEETGRFLLPSPLLGTTVLAAPLIAALGTPEQRAGLLPRLADGRLTATLAVPRGTLPAALALTAPNDGGWPGGDRTGGDRPSGDWSGGGRSGGVQARQTGDGWRLFGSAAQVPAGHGADLLLVAAHTGGYARGHPALFTVVPDERVRCTRLTAMDETRAQARVEFRDAPAEPLGPQPVDARPALAGLGGPFAAVLAAEATGAADRALELTLEHVRTREQFGRPIGSFQAVKHRLADLYVAVRAARSAAYYAAWAVARPAGADRSTHAVQPTGADRSTHAVQPAGADRPADAHRSTDAAQSTDAEQSTGADRPAGAARRSATVALALAQALRTQCLVAGEAVQLHGGLGVTWEHDAQLYFKRAASDAVLFGPVHRLRARAAEAVGLFEEGRYQEAVVL